MRVELRSDSSDVWVDATAAELVDEPLRAAEAMAPTASWDASELRAWQGRTRGAERRLDGGG